MEKQNYPYTAHIEALSAASHLQNAMVEEKDETLRNNYLRLALASLNEVIANLEDHRNRSIDKRLTYEGRVEADKKRRERNKK